MINLAREGAHSRIENAGPNAGHRIVDFSIPLPGIRAADGFQVIALLIHEEDQFTPEIPAREFPLNYIAPVAAGEHDRWAIGVDLTANADPAPSSFGQPGRYLYRYQLRRNGNVVTRVIPDPFARQAGEGDLSAFDTDPPVGGFNWNDANYRTPALDDLIVYELQVEQFNDTFDGVIDRLKYLQGLGVNCLELMPVTSLKQDFDWGYGPLHFLAPRDRFGSGDGLRRLVDACHARGIAVILDVVYQHVDTDFAYCRPYREAQIQSPMIGDDGDFGPRTRFDQDFTQEYFLAVNQFWLEEYHVDGFRYDNVSGFYDKNPATKYGTLVFNTYMASLPIPRFTTAAGHSAIIQVAEDLDDPQLILKQTYTNATWQNALLGKAENKIRFGVTDEEFCHLLDPLFSGYPDTQTMNGVNVPVAPFQYVDSHDHSHLVWYTKNSPDDDGKTNAGYADRDLAYKLQPYAIALYTCQGVPMLWEGQEFADNYVLPPGGDLRIHFRRTMNWRFFYDETGRSLIRLYRILAKLRRNNRALRSRQTFYYNQQSRPGEGIIAYHRRASAVPAGGGAPAKPEQIAMVVLNFSDQPRSMWIPFPKAGAYQESIDGGAGGAGPAVINIAHDDDFAQVTVPSNYGYVYLGP